MAGTPDHLLGGAVEEAQDCLVGLRDAPGGVGDDDRVADGVEGRIEQRVGPADFREQFALPAQRLFEQLSPFGNLLFEFLIGAHHCDLSGGGGPGLLNPARPARLLITTASSSGSTGLATCIWKPATSARRRSSVRL